MSFSPTFWIIAVVLTLFITGILTSSYNHDKTKACKVKLSGEAFFIFLHTAKTSLERTFHPSKACLLL